ncbi:MAG: YaeQ family protein [Bdellovibrionaceae bacterium]|nr:YaeQ family protein [Bdellovibrio sp.]
MALPSKLYRFKIELSDVPKEQYQSLDFRVAQHPSESLPYLLTRVFAYALSYQEGIEFSSGGLSDPDHPCLSVLSPSRDMRVWIEIGNPSARKIHKASKASPKLKIFTYKDPNVLLNEMNQEVIHRKSEIEVYSISPAALERLSLKLKKDNKWTVVVMDGTVMVNAEDITEEFELKRHQ